MSILDFFRPKCRTDSERIQLEVEEARQKAAESEAKLRAAEDEVADAIECAIDAGNAATATLSGFTDQEMEEWRNKLAKGES